MNRLLKYKYWWAAAVVILVAVIYLSNALRYRIDLTAEKRFTINDATKKLLDNIDSTVTIKLFLTGDLPADYKKLGMSAKDLLDEFRDISHNLVKVSVENIKINYADTAKFALIDKSYLKNKQDTTNVLEGILLDSLSRMGIVFDDESLTDYQQKKIKLDQLIIPSALVYYGNKKPFAIDLRSSRKVFKNFNVINDVPQEDKEATLNAAEALLEFKFANAIDKLTRTYEPTVAYLVGNGEPIDHSVDDLGKSVDYDYKLAIFNLKVAYPDPKLIDALLIVKPTKPFTDEDKLKLDQFVMHGGKIIWFVDKLYAEMDSLQRSQADFVALDRNLNLDDILFRYGVRINDDLVQDLNCSKIPIVIGQNPDGSPRMQRIPWPYYPFLSSTNNNPISKNLDRVLPIFPSSIDTVKAPGVYKTILLATDTNSRVLSSPAMVSLNSVKDDADFASFNRSYIPVAVLLEGKFTSLFANRLTKDIKDSVAKATSLPFAAESVKDTKQIVVADADIVTNQVSPSSGSLPMGELPLENYRFANREFFLNCVDYLVSNSGLFQLRNRDFTLRLLDKKKVEAQKTTWQLINIALPVVLIILFGAIYQWNRKRKFAV
ncbi:MAG TPA: gliding motility-associated ABC transporter substrate-binding protein GldG [Chitinophagaceae bacterium]|nr:gliding motility-associated ABC transporter substrate-binding protein GldG [Chitinophagaceae bacterium]